LRRAATTTADVFTMWMMAIAGAVMALLTALVKPICSLFGLFINVEQVRQISRLETVLSKNGWCSGYVMSARMVPDYGPHCILLPRLLQTGDRGIVLMYKTEVGDPSNFTYDRYHMFVLSFTPNQTMYSNLKHLLDGDPSNVLVQYLEKPTPVGYRITSLLTLPEGPPHDWQAAATKQILALYNSKKMVSALLYGKSGAGKSEMGVFVAQAMKRELGVDPIVKLGVSFTNAGVSVGGLLEHPVESRPVILVLDEYHKVVEYAENNKETGERCTSLARTRQGLCNALDMINRHMYVIFLATTTEEPGSFLADLTRDGRFTLKIPAK
jgi:hypothetical protein